MSIHIWWPENNLIFANFAPNEKQNWQVSFYQTFTEITYCVIKAQNNHYRVSYCSLALGHPYQNDDNVQLFCCPLCTCFILQKLHLDAFLAREIWLRCIGIVMSFCNMQSVPVCDKHTCLSHWASTMGKTTVTRIHYIIFMLNPNISVTARIWGEVDVYKCITMLVAYACLHDSIGNSYSTLCLLKWGSIPTYSFHLIHE